VKKKWRKRLMTLLERDYWHPSPVQDSPTTFRTLTICFADKTIDIDGRHIKVDANCLTIPILSDQAIYMPKGMDRIA